MILNAHYSVAADLLVRRLGLIQPQPRTVQRLDVSTNVCDFVSDVNFWDRVSVYNYARALNLQGLLPVFVTALNFDRNWVVFRCDDSY